MLLCKILYAFNLDAEPLFFNKLLIRPKVIESDIIYYAFVSTYLLSIPDWILYEVAETSNAL